MWYSKRKGKGLLLLIVLCAVMAMSGFTVKKAEAESASTVNHAVREDLVTVVNETTLLRTQIAEQTDEDYAPSSRRWNGMPSVIAAGNNLFVAWQTGGVKEPDPDKLNYIVVVVSTDGGETWIDPFIIIDPIEDNLQAQVPTFYYNHEGELCLLFNIETKGIHTLKIRNADGDLKDITYDEPYPIGPRNSSFTKPTLLKDGRIMYASGGVATSIFCSNDDGLTFSAIAQVDSETPETDRRFSESSVVEKQDGTLWHLRRLENAASGGMEQSFSIDGGASWSMAEADLPAPLQGPGSRFTMQRLSSGALLLVNNVGGRGMIRPKMTAFLSYDDGESWPYSLLLDPLQSSYPDFYQDADGKIFIVFDKDRYGEGGIRLCVVTEDDIKAGAYVSEQSKQLISLTKTNYEYADIKTVNGAFPRVAVYKVGTPLKKILENYSTTIHVTDENGTTHEITGVYRVSNFKQDVAGTYRAYFSADLRTTLKDSFSLLEFDIVLEKGKGGCSSTGMNGGGILPFGVLLLGAAQICGRIFKRRTNDVV